MAKITELRDMSDEQLGLTLKEANENLFRLRIQAADRKARRAQRAAPQSPAGRPNQNIANAASEESSSEVIASAVSCSAGQMRPTEN